MWVGRGYALGELVHIGLADDDCAGGPESLHDGVIAPGPVLGQRCLRW